jgi:hypothetical protein
MKFYPVIAAGNGAKNTIYAATITGGATSGLITTGPDMLIRIAAVNPVTVRFGSSASLTTADATDILVIGSEIFDMGHNNNAIVIYAPATTLVSVSVVVRN